jgi:hypothetical protein
MNESNDNYKKTSNHDFEVNREKKDIINLLSSEQIENYIKNLSNPSFLGSIHLKKETQPNIQTIDRLLKEELESKVNNSIKSSIFNPITKILIIAAIAFNIFWFVFAYFW